MLFFDRLRHLGPLRSLSERVQAVPQGFRRRPAFLWIKRSRKPLLGAGLLVISAALGSSAHDLALNEALGQWLSEHPPSSRIWAHALESRGYQKLTELAQIQRVSKSLPALWDEDGSTWVTSEGNWIAIFQKLADGTESVFYCAECKDLPRKWEPMGRGWSAFDPTLARADAAVKNRKSTIQRPKLALDPRELRY